MRKRDIVAGGLSDLLAVSLGEATDIRDALVAMSILYLPPAYFMWRADHTIAEDAER